VSALRGALVWAAWTAAFSPVLLDLARHQAESPWARYAAIFPLLFAVCALREPRPHAKQPGGALLIALGLASALVAAFLGVVRYARIGAALAAIGLCRRFALASARTQVLLAFAVPLPLALMKRFHPDVTSVLLEACAGVLAVAGLTFELHGTDARLGDQVLSLGRPDSGIPLMPLLAGLTWYDGCRLGRPIWRAAAAASGAALLALPVQAVAIGLALVLTSAGDAALARDALTHGPWIAVAAAALAFTEVRAGRRTRA
jgi:hypothetical protein